MAQPAVSFTIDNSQVQFVFQNLPQAIRDELSTGIRNIVEKVKDTINTDYRRSGTAYPSYLNPSASGLGFTDRSGSLRQSITAWVEENGESTVGYVSAGTDYDKYVELLWGGKYSFMLPAFTQNQDYILNEVFEAVLRGISRFII